MSWDFLWDEPEVGSRGPKPALTLPRIADAAIAIADAEGLAAVSMQRVATTLGFTKMSLYRYLPGKAELVALMVERGMGPCPHLDDLDCRAALAGWSKNLLVSYLRHPWSLEATSGPRPMGPNEIGWLECALRVVPLRGLAASERLDTIAVLAGHVRSIAERAAVRRMSEGDLIETLETRLSRHGDRFPALRATLTASADEDGRELAFQFGLDRILDGVELLIARRAG